MIALLLLGLSSVAWMVIAAALVFVYKVVPLPRGMDAALGIASIAAGLLVAVRA